MICIICVEARLNAPFYVRPGLKIEVTLLAEHRHVREGDQLQHAMAGRPAAGPPLRIHCPTTQGMIKGDVLADMLPERVWTRSDGRDTVRLQPPVADHGQA